MNPQSVVAAVGLGEDVSFSQSIIDPYGCIVHGFDPTPRAITYVKRLACQKLVLHEYGIGSATVPATLYLPNNAAHVSGTLKRVDHVGRERIDVRVLSIDGLFDAIGASRIDLLKLDIEDAEYDVISSPSFRKRSPHIGMICIEFHHRWKEFGRAATVDAVRVLRGAGFKCAWTANETNEEFLFVSSEVAATPA